MKPQHIISILESMSVEDLVRWFNYWLDHYGTEYRNTIVPNSAKQTVPMAIQISDDRNYGFIDPVLTKISGLRGNYIYYDYDGENLTAFNTVKDILEYFDIENFIVMFEDEEYYTYDKVFGWMDKKEPTVKEKLQKDAEDYTEDFINAFRAGGIQSIPLQQMSAILPSMYEHIAEDALKKYGNNWNTPFPEINITKEW